MRKSQVIESLCSLLTEGDAADRCYSCRALGVIGDSTVVSALVEKLRDEDIDVCVDAAEALGRLDDRSAVAALLESLYKDPDGEVKTAVLEALGRIGGDEVIEALLEVAAGCPEDLIIDDYDTWDPWWDMQLKSVQALARMGVARAVPVLIAILNDEDGQDIESEVLKALAMIGGNGEQFLIQRLKHGTSRQRRRAATALGQTNSAAVIDALAAALNDASADVRSVAVEGLARYNAQQYLHDIVLLLKDPDPAVRAAVISASNAMQLDHGESIAGFIDLLGDANPQVRCAVLNALHRQVDRFSDEARVMINDAIKHDNAEVAAAACSLLSHIGDVDAQLQLLQVLNDTDRTVYIRAKAALALGALGIWNNACAMALTDAVVDDARPLRLAGLNALMELDAAIQVSAQSDETDNRPIEIVIDALSGKITLGAKPATVIPIIPLQDNHPELSLDAGIDAPAMEIADTDELHVGPDQDYPVDIMDEDELDRAGTSSTLASIAIDNVQAMLISADTSNEESNETDQQDDALQEYNDIIRKNKQAANWLFARDTEQVEIDVRRLAARILGNIHTQDPVTAKAIEVLLAALADVDVVLQTEAAESIGRIAAQDNNAPGLDKAFDDLLALVDAEDRNLRIASVRALGFLGNGKAIPLQLQCLDTEDTSLRIQAIRSLTNLAIADPDLQTDPSTNDQACPIKTLAKRFLALLDDPEAGIRSAAINGFTTLTLHPGLTGETSLLEEAVAHIVNAAMTGNGIQAREFGKALRDINPDLATVKLLLKLNTLTTSGERRFVIEMLEEIHATKEQKISVKAA